MARLEIEIGVKGASSVGKSLSDIENNLSKLNVSYAKTVQEIAKVTQVTNELEGELRNLSSQLKTGAISQSQFDKESTEVTQALGSARQSAQQYQSQLASLQATIKQNVTAQSDLGDATKKLKPVHKDFQHGVASANGVALEFGRIVQDLPYGMHGVANNLQQLSTNFGYYVTRAREAAAANGQVLTSTQLVKGVFSSLISPANLLTLGISLITAGWVAYEKWTQKVDKANKEAQKNVKTFADDLKTFADSQNAVSRASVQGQVNSQKELVTLNSLRTAIEDESISRDKRLQMIKNIQKEYPEYFGQLSNEEILAGNVKGAYDRLTQSILATGKARAAINIQADAYEQLAQIELRREKRLVSIAKIEKGIADTAADIRAKGGLVPDITDQQVKNVSNVSDFLLFQGNEVDKLSLKYIELQNSLSSLTDERTKDGLAEIGLLQDIDKLQGIVNNSVKSGGDIVSNASGKTNKALKESVDLLNTFDSKLAAIIGKSDNSASQSGLVGVDLDIEKTRQKYAALFQSVNDLETESLKNTKLTEQERNNIISSSFDARQTLANNYIKEQEDNEQKRVGITEETETKIANISLDYTRRLKEKQSQIMIRQLNDEFKAREKLANDTLTTEAERLAAQAKLQEEYWQRLDLVQKFAEIEDLSLALGDAVGNAFENMLTNGTDIFTSLVAEFKKAILKMIAQGAALSASKMFGKLLGIGANVATGGGAGIFGKIVKGLFGFQSGGYTGNIPKNQVAGVVHGQEMVMDAKATRKYGSLLNSMQNGSFNPNSMGTISPVISGDKDIYIAETVIRGTDLVTVYKRAEKSIGRYGS